MNSESLIRRNHHSEVVSCQFSQTSLFKLVARFDLFIWLHHILAAAYEIFAGTCELSCPVAHEILGPWPGLEHMSPALKGGFLTAGPPGKS